MNRTEKLTIVADVRERIARLPNVYLTDFTGLKVKQVTDLRRRLRQAGLEYVVLKNTLAQRALAEVDVTGLDAALAGPTGWVFAEDPVTAAKIITDFQKEAETFQVKAGLVEGRTVTPDEIKRLAKLPSRPGCWASWRRVPGTATGVPGRDQRALVSVGWRPRGAPLAAVRVCVTW
jgi:large subunit ribosomal protein L10